MKLEGISGRVGIPMENLGRVSLAVGIVALYVAYYAHIVPPLVSEWREHENFSYGFLIPLISLYLLWEKRHLISKVNIRFEIWGGVGLLITLTFGVIGRALGEPFLDRVAFVVGIPALVWFLWGGQMARRLLFPLGYLILMVPPPYAIVKAVSFHLRMSDAWIVSHLVQMVGVPLYRDSYFLHLPNITLEVADVCSGIASLFAMIALGILYIYYLPVRLAAKGTMLGAAFVFPIIANLVRIFLVTVSVYYYGPVMLGAFYHQFTGTFTFSLALVMFIWFGEFLRRRFPASKLASQEQPAKETLAEPVAGVPEAAGWLRTAIIVGAFVLLGGALASDHFRGAGLQLQLPKLASISRNIGRFDGMDAKAPDMFMDARAEVHVSRVYKNPDGAEIELFLGYRSNQLDENRLQSPRLIFPEHWEYSSIEPLRLPISATRSIDATGLVTKRSNDKKLVIYWYQVRGQSLAGDFRHRWELLKNLVFENRTDGAVVRLATRVRDGEAMEEAKRRLVEFGGELYPHLLAVLPK